jgi:hypothetical protein
MRRKDGTWFCASGITTALKDESGTVVGFSKVLRDVTETKQSEERLERTVAERTRIYAPQTNSWRRSSIPSRMTCARALAR